MKKLLSGILLISSLAFAEVATKSDIVNLSNQMKETNKIMIELIKSEIRANRDLIIANQKATERRFEDMQKASDRRFDAVDKRFEDMQKASDKRFEDMQKYMDNRFNTIITFLSLLFTIMIGGFSALMWYLVKDREVIKKDIKEELETQLTKKADVKLVNDIIRSLSKRFFKIVKSSN